MGETDETKTGIPSGEKAPPPGKEGTTPEEETPQTFTQEQVDKVVQAALTKAGRDAKAIETQKNEITQQAEAIEATKADIERMKQEQDAALMESIKSNPDAVDWVKLKRELEEGKKTLTKQQADFNKKVLEYDGKIKAAEEAQAEMNIFSVASAKNVDPMRLKALSDKFGITDKDKLEELADEITSGTTTTDIHIDSGKTTGAKTQPKTADEKLDRGFQEADKKK